MKLSAWIVLACLIELWAGCTSSPVSQNATSQSATAPPANTSGAVKQSLGTAFGEERSSPVVDVTFVRNNPNEPAGVEIIRYDSAAGVKKLAKEHAEYSSPPGTGLVTVQILNNANRPYPTVSRNGWNYVIGEPGARYQIVITNQTHRRIEIVASVDGLDVTDGAPASYQKRGYVLAPGEVYAIDGFRTSQNSVAAFRFSSVEGSYANQKYGLTANVGVIGVAVFTEKGARILNSDGTVNPFPGNS